MSVIKFVNLTRCQLMLLSIHESSNEGECCKLKPRDGSRMVVKNKPRDGSRMVVKNKPRQGSRNHEMVVKTNRVMELETTGW